MTTQRAGSRDHGGAVSRRAVLKTGSLTGAAALLLGLGGFEDQPLGELTPLSGNGPLNVTLTRREDQLSLTFELHNLQLLKVGEAGPGDQNTARLARVSPAEEAYLVVHFGPQALAEQAIHDGGGGGEPLYTPVMAAVVGGSRLAFQLPDSVVTIPYQVRDLLDWGRLTPSVVATAHRAVSGTPEPTQPSMTQTAIEAPARLVLSPHEKAGWAHAVEASETTHAGRTELWHTRLGVRAASGVDEGDADARTVRAVWTGGFNRSSPPPVDQFPAPPGLSSLSNLDRYEIVRLSSDYNIKNLRKDYLPQPLAVEQLALSPLGAWVKADGHWPDVHDDLHNLTFVVQSLSYRAPMGREQYVRVVKGGFLFPFGHRASLIEVTERKFATINQAGHPQHGKTVAFLRRREFIVVREAERTYPGRYGTGASPAAQPYEGREMPFKTVRITTKVTPNLVLVTGPGADENTQVPRPVTDADPYYGSEAFWPRVATGPNPNESEDVVFSLVVTDAEGGRSSLQMPLLFIQQSITDDVDRMQEIIEHYDADAQLARRAVPMQGQRVALADFDDGTPGECAYPIETVTFGASEPVPPNGGLDPFRQPRFFPRLDTATVRLDAVERVAGAAQAAPTIKLHDAWLTGASNPARLFAALADPVDLAFGANTSGGVVTPNMQITGLSGRTGPMGGDLSGAAAPPQFDPKDFFAGAAPKLLGGISLLDIIGLDDFNGASGSPGRVPRLSTTPVAQGMETALTWKPRLVPGEVFGSSDNSTMTIVARSLVRADGGRATSEVSGDITDFQLHAVGASLRLVTVHFRRLRFVSADGAKPDIEADVADVEFHGILNFVNTLRQYLSSSGLANGVAPAKKVVPSGRAVWTKNLAAANPGPTDGSFVDVTPSGITVGYTLALPAVAVGMFSLENISLGSALHIPFGGQPARVRFAFAERDRPFQLSVLIFAGGGFVGVSFGLDQFELFEAALEFGAKLALDVVVASGSVTAMAGVYLAIGAAGGELTGYLRLNGELDILGGLVSMAIEFYLGLTYDTGQNELWGEASVTVSIDVVVFSGSVTLGPVRKRFAGGGTSGAAAAVAPAQQTLAVGARTANATGLSFDDLISANDWSDYCDLYAPAAFA